MSPFFSDKSHNTSVKITWTCSRILSFVCFFLQNMLRRLMKPMIMCMKNILCATIAPTKIVQTFKIIDRILPWILKLGLVNIVNKTYKLVSECWYRGLLEKTYISYQNIKPSVRDSAK